MAMVNLTKTIEKRAEYNAKDVLATSAILTALEPTLNERTRRIYEAEMGLQGVCSAVQLRGLLIDPGAKQEVLAELQEEIDALQQATDDLIGRELNPRSPPQVCKLMYEDCHLTPQKKDGKVTTDKEALARIAKRLVPVKGDFPTAKRKEFKDMAATVAANILRARDVGKQKSSVNSATYHGRHRFTINVGGTESFRFSSHKSHDGKGINGQNVDKRLKRIYIPDPGFIMGQMDQERAESMTVAYASADPAYIRAPEGC